MKPHILVVDDEVDMVTMITRILSREGWQVTSANSSEEALVLIQKHHPDAVVLDLRLPSIGGLAVCRLLRENPSTRSIPVIMLTAQSSDIDKVIGLETGADDYITKPFNPMELLARLKAVLRRSTFSQTGPAVLSAGIISMDIDCRMVTVAEVPVKLTIKEFDILQLLLKSPGKVFAREYLIESIFGYCIEGTTRTLDTHIWSLRKKLGPAAAAYIQTVEGIGYRFMVK